MRVTVTVSDDQGRTFQGEFDLVPTATRRGDPPRRVRGQRAPADSTIDFGLPRRAFLKKHACGSGPSKFAILLAHMTGGKTDVQVTSESIETEWKRNKGVLGGDYQGMYATRSKGEGWTDSPKRGTFVLRAHWRGALK